MGYKLIRKLFIYAPDHGCKEWGISGEFGSISFWIERDSSSSSREFYGGVEFHYNEKSKPDYMSEGSHHKICMQSGGECWHDGTSLWASEYWIPMILPQGDEAIWKRLEQEYPRLNPKERTE